MSVSAHVAALTVALALLHPAAASASEPSPSQPSQEPTTAMPAPAAPPHVWGVETETVQPFIPEVGILRLRVTRTLWGTPIGLRGDLLVGAYVRPHITHDVVETIDEYMGSLGYRQYLWRGAHAEVGIYAGAAWGRNRFDGKEYRTPTLFGEMNVGYRFGFFEPGGIVEGRGSAVGFFVTPQFGVLSSLGIANDIGPRNGKPDIFPQGTLLLGASF